MSRLAIIEREKCINKGGCEFICGKVCPINRTGAECIVESEVDNKPIIDEILCSGCGICPKRCPTQCISIIKLPEKLKMDPIHRYGENAFELFNLPIPKKGKVVGILGRNGIGKSTALNVLAGVVKPNLGNFKEQPTDEEIIEKYSTTMLGDYFKKLFSGNIAVSYKPQRIDQIPKQYKGTVIELLTKIDEKGIAKKLLKELDMENLVDRDISKLSGGELQKVAIIAAASRKSDVYYFDEPASFLDVTTRIKVAKLIRSLCVDAAVLVVEHDLATLDYISDEIQIVYGEQSAYGIISQSKAVRRGINEYLDGYLPDDNVRFRDYSIKFFQTAAERHVSKNSLLKFPELEKNYETFSLTTKEGEVKKAEILVVMGANGLGKSTFLQMLSGQIKPDTGKVEKVKIAFKEQYPVVIKGTVKEVLMAAAKEKFTSGWYKQAILDKLGLRKLLDNEVKTLSGGELQKLHIALTLSQACEIYAFDEPSAFIDVEDRLIVAEVIKDFVIKNEVCAIVVDHDVQFIDYIGDSMLVFEGIPGKQGSVYGPVTKKEGMNKVLEMLDITYRQDKESKRPRINKPGSQLDQQQRRKGNFYYH
ncbi:MAG: ribosome biogenesis/translation initiation ATPase RLI [Nanoarchaeota archaeon]|nr:ribosome biogenesis/translation initiation ATPase RLI [Nanoarchaeota archaeon]